jgi:hypothetical protein
MLFYIQYNCHVRTSSLWLTYNIAVNCCLVEFILKSQIFQSNIRVLMPNLVPYSAGLALQLKFES